MIHNSSLTKFENTFIEVANAICIKDEPEKVGNGRNLKKGNIIRIHGILERYSDHMIFVSAIDENSFYNVDHFQLLR